MSVYGLSRCRRDSESTYKREEVTGNMEYTSNYERQCEEWRKTFLTMDQEDICRRLPEIHLTEEKLELWHFGRLFTVDRKDGRICVSSDNKPVDAMPKMNIYTLFWHAAQNGVHTGKWVPYQELKGASPFEAAFKKGILQPIALTFSGKEELLERAVKSLRGERVSASGFLLKAFECIPVRLNFWDADEEFPAQANLLFDSSATDFNHEESIATIATEGMYQLADAAGLQLTGSPFIRF